MTAALLDAKAAAELLSVPHTWLLAEARHDRVPHVRLGRYVRFDPDELERWWRGRMRGPINAGRGARLESSPRVADTQDRHDKTAAGARLQSPPARPTKE